MGGLFAVISEFIAPLLAGGEAIGSAIGAGAGELASGIGSGLSSLGSTLGLGAAEGAGLGAAEGAGLTPEFTSTAGLSAGEAGAGAGAGAGMGGFGSEALGAGQFAASALGGLGAPLPAGVQAANALSSVPNMFQSSWTGEGGIGDMLGVTAEAPTATATGAAPMGDMPVQGLSGWDMTGGAASDATDPLNAMRNAGGGAASTAGSMAQGLSVGGEGSGAQGGVPRPATPKTPADSGGSAWSLDKIFTPANVGALGLAGLASHQAGAQPALPRALSTMQSVNTPITAAAQSSILSGGTSGADWSQQKAAIDSNLAQQFQQQSAALMQQQANTGQGGMVAQQQLNQLRQQMEIQRQQAYAAAQQQNVQNAIKEMSSGNAALQSVGNTQYQQSVQAQNAAQQTMSLAGRLYGMQSGSRDRPAVWGGP